MWTIVESKSCGDWWCWKEGKKRERERGQNEGMSEVGDARGWQNEKRDLLRVLVESREVGRRGMKHKDALSPQSQLNTRLEGSRGRRSQVLAFLRGPMGGQEKKNDASR